MNDTPSTQPRPQVVGLSWAQIGIGYVIVAAFVAALFTWMLYPPNNVNPVALAIINMLIGALISKFSTVVDYCFGSSQGNKEKDNAQNDVMRTLAASVVPGTGNGAPAAVTAAAKLAAPAAARAAAPAAAAAAAPPAAEVAAPPAAEVAVAEAMAKRDEEHK